MKLHRNAKLTPTMRHLLVQRVLEHHWGLRAASTAAGVSVRTGAKWVARFRQQGRPGLDDRSSAPRHRPRRTPPATVAAIVTLRQQRLPAWTIAHRLGLARSTVTAILARVGLNQLARLTPVPPVQRYERRRPGELVHVDIKPLGRIAGPGHRVTGQHHGRRHPGWEAVHVCVDDHSRVAYVEVLPNRRGPVAAAFFRRAVAWFRAQGVRIERVLTDNGPAYYSRPFARICHRAQVRHLFTRPYRPQTNGKAERFIQTLQREWAYRCPYASSAARAATLPRWVQHYNCERPHHSLAQRTPWSRLTAISDEQRV
jgi:transposase InsO family protein